MLVMLLTLATTPLRSARPSVVIRRPTIIAFFSVTQKELKRDPDTNESLADFQIYVDQARERLAKMGIDLREVYARSFRVIIADRVSIFRAAAQDCGYYFVAPGKTARIEYGVETDTDLVQLSTEYFGIAKP
jgi:hypothetical protein